jgi:8-oxo-dGTP pyrophosphatase MutT (NUDIX family)
MRVRAGAILIQNEKILLAEHHKKAHGYEESYFVLPGGTVDPHETIEETLIREIKEEAGLSVTVKKLVLIHQSVDKKWRQDVQFIFKVQLKGGHLKEAINQMTDPALRSLQWIALKDFEKTNFKPGIQKEILDCIDHPGGAIKYLGNL